MSSQWGKKLNARFDGVTQYVANLLTHLICYGYNLVAGVVRCVHVERGPVFSIHSPSFECYEFMYVLHVDFLIFDFYIYFLFAARVSKIEEIY